MRTDFEQKLIDLILQDKYADTKMEQIKQAFIDEGWMSYTLAEPALQEIQSKLERVVEKHGKCMTGPEWHTRFNREYSRGLREEEAMSLGDIARHAAGRACGCIQENE